MNASGFPGTTRPAELCEWHDASRDAACNPASHAASHAAYEVRFESLFHGGRGLSFPCDAQGRVALHRMSERARDNYRRAHEQVGIEYATPAVMLSDLH